MKLKDFQDQFQRAILDGDDGILRDIPDGPRETKTNLLGIYRDAYRLRLIEVIGNDHELLRAYVGEDQFCELARAYIDAHPSHHPNARWFPRRLPEFLRDQEPYAKQTVLAELAALERALNDAFDGVDAPVLGLADLTAIPPEVWPQLTFMPHPTARCLEVRTNAADIWTALKKDTEPPPPELAAQPKRILVWRQDSTAMFRTLGREEAMMWAETEKGARFGALCEMLAAYDDPAGAPARAAPFLKSWLEAGLLSEAVVAEPAPS